MWSGIATNTVSDAFGPVTDRAIDFGYLTLRVLRAWRSSPSLSGFAGAVPTSVSGGYTVEDFTPYEGCARHLCARFTAE